MKSYHLTIFLRCVLPGHKINFYILILLNFFHRFYYSFSWHLYCFTENMLLTSLVLLILTEWVWVDWWRCQQKPLLSKTTQAKLKFPEQSGAADVVLHRLCCTRQVRVPSDPSYFQRMSHVLSMLNTSSVLFPQPPAWNAFH